MRRFIYDLRPSPLADEPLSRQVERFVQDLQTAYQIGVDFRWTEAPRAFSAEERLAVYRVAQEAMQNARKHARADRIIVDACVEPTDWVIRISDTGVGFDPTAAALLADHWGMCGMRERAHLVGAVLTVDSRPGEGTTVTFRLPLYPPQRAAGRP